MDDGIELALDLTICQNDLRDAKTTLETIANLAQHTLATGYTTERLVAGLRKIKEIAEMNDRANRTDLCEECRDEDHATCSLDPDCSCCLTTLAQMAEE